MSAPQHRPNVSSRTGKRHPRALAVVYDSGAVTTPHPLAFLLAALSLAVACEPAPDPPIPDPPDPPVVVVDPVMNWVVGDDDTDAWSAALDLADTHAPDGLVLGGALSPALLDGEPDSLTGEALAAFVAGLGEDISLGLQLSALGADLPGSLCADPANPGSEPHLAARAARLASLLTEHPEVAELSVAVAGPPAPWDTDCACAPCGQEGAAGHLDAVFDGLTADLPEGVASWWWDSLSGPASADIDAASAMDGAVEGHSADDLPRVRAAIYRGAPHLWAPENPRLRDDAERTIAADLDFVCAPCGPTEAPLVFADSLYDRIRLDRSRGVTTWYGATDGGGQSAWGRPEEANIVLATQWAHDPLPTPSEALEAWVAAEYNLDPTSQSTVALAEALRQTGRAYSLVTHPLGIPVANLEDGVGALPLSYVDPRPWGEGWDVRWQTLTDPGGQTLVDANQWGVEGVELAAAAVLAFEDGGPSLPASAAVGLRQRLAVLHFATRAWKLLVGADLTLKVYLADPQAERARWLRQDADDLDDLSAEIQTALDSGAILDPFPANPDELGSVASQLRSAMGTGASVERPFPTITEVRWDFEDDRTNVKWTLSEPGAGWWERGPGWPQPYDNPSGIGEGPADIWHAWTSSVEPDQRVPFRACGEAAGYRVCSADNVFWSAQ